MSVRLAICTDTYAPQMNGVARTLERLATAVRERGGEARVFTTSDPRAVACPDHVRWPSMACPGYPELRIAPPMMRSVRAALRDFSPTIVHAATPFGIGLAARAAARSLDIPFVTSYHTSFSAYAQHYGVEWLTEPSWRFLRWFHNSGRQTFCPTHAVRTELETRGFDDLTIWGRGVDGARFSPAHRCAEMRARLGAGPDTMIVAYVGRIAVEKGIDDMLAAGRLLEAGANDLRFAFAGDGPYLNRCRAAAPATSCFLGRLEGAELAAFYASADAFVFPSVTDTFGNVLLEAMASGLPVIAAESPATREVLGGTGELYPPGSARDLAAALRGVSADALRRERLATAALRRSRDFRWNAVFDKLYQQYALVHRQHRERSRFSEVYPAPELTPSMPA